MAESRISTLRALWAPKIVRYGALTVAAIAAYDGFSSQFDTPKLGEILGMSGNLLPWWGWLLILQAIFVYALFEYVRRLQMPGSYDDTELRAKIGEVNTFTEATAEALSQVMADKMADFEARLQALDSNTVGMLRHYNKMQGFPDRLDVLEQQYPKVIDDYQRMVAATDESKLTQADTARKLDMLFLAFQALLARERINRLSEHIHREGEFLMCRVLAREPVKSEHWTDWQSHKVTFDSAMEHWLNIASGWQPNVKDWVNKVEPRALTDGRWVGLDSLFEGSNAVITYQTFALRFERWKQFESNVRNAIHITAFGGPNAAAVLRGLPNGGPDLDNVTEKLSG